MSHEDAVADRRVVLERRLPRPSLLVGRDHGDLGREDGLARWCKTGPPKTPDAHAAHPPLVRSDLQIEVESLAGISRSAVGLDRDDGQLISVIPEPREDGRQQPSDEAEYLLPPVVEHSFLLSVNRVQGDRGAAVPAAVSHSSTPPADFERRVTAALDRLEKAERAADKARQRVLKEGAA